MKYDFNPQNPEELQSEIEKRIIFSGSYEDCEEIAELVIPEGITELGEGAFEHCRNIQAIRLPNSLESIAKDAFLTCASLYWLYIPANVREIGRRAFSARGKGVDTVDEFPTLQVRDNFYAFRYTKENKIPYQVLPEHNRTLNDFEK